MAGDLDTLLAERHAPAGIVAAVAALVLQRPAAPVAAPPSFVAAIAGLVRDEALPPHLPAWLRRAAASLGSCTWRRNPTYGDAAFLERYAYAELVGPGGDVPFSGAAFGLLALAPHTHYPAHAHPAVESYVVLLGTAEWQAGAAPWATQHPPALVHHPSGVPHAMRTGAEPLLAAWLWTGDLTAPARLVASS